MPRTAAGLIAVLFAPLAGCQAFPTVAGSGNVVAEKREVGAFHAVAVGGSGEVAVEQGAAPALTVEADDNILPLVRADVEGGTLHLGLKTNVSVQPTKPVKFRLTVADLDAVSVAGSATVAADRLRADTLALSVSGSGGVAVGGLTAKTLAVSVSGSGSVTLSGTAGTATVSISGSGSVKAGDLAAAAVTAKISGSGTADVRAADTLDAAVSGSGHVKYRGSPKVTQRVSGSGSVRPGE